MFCVAGMELHFLWRDRGARECVNGNWYALTGMDRGFAVASHKIEMEWTSLFHPPWEIIDFFVCCFFIAIKFIVTCCKAQ